LNRVLCRLLVLGAPLAVSCCGDLPQPFAGNPGATAMRLARPPPPRLVIPPPGAALLPQPDAALWAQAMTTALVAEEIPAFATTPLPGDWQLQMTAAVQGDTVVPHFTVLDGFGKSRGDITGEPAPEAAWAAGDKAVLTQVAQKAAPPILDLLRSVDASIKQSDKNSLYNRPARIYFAGVTGAPGDGNHALARQIRAKLPDTGDLLVKAPDGADFTLRGTVKITDMAGNQQQVEIHWKVFDPDGKEAGDVAQGHDVEKGSLDHYWGDVAAAVADEAAGGVHEVITNWTGRRRKAEQAASDRKSWGEGAPPPKPPVIN
jgi:hypothetical protein